MSKDLIKKILKEELTEKKVLISEELKYHLDNDIKLHENVFRPYSKSFFDLVNEVRNLYNKNLIELCEEDIELIKSDLGKRIINENGVKIYLDCPFEEGSPEQLMIEAEYKGKKVELNKPKRGGSKKYYVYVKNPSTGKIKKIEFGDTTGLSAKVSNPKARKAFASRHQCDKKKDKTKAGYWACRINKYAYLWGNRTYPGYW